MTAQTVAQPFPAKQLAGKPNIVLVLMDDFSMDLVQTMRAARDMRRRGASYSHAFVVDSLCCVSRSSSNMNHIKLDPGTVGTSQTLISEACLRAMYAYYRGVMGLRVAEAA